MKVIRFNQIQPGLDPVEMSARYKATLDMAQYADEHGFDMISLCLLYTSDAADE